MSRDLLKNFFNELRAIIISIIVLVIILFITHLFIIYPVISHVPYHKVLTKEKVIEYLQQQSIQDESSEKVDLSVEEINDIKDFCKDTRYLQKTTKNNEKLIEQCLFYLNQ